MKKILIPVLIALVFASCEKKVDPVDGSNAIVTLNTGDPKYITGDITVNPKDSLIFSYTVTSTIDMGFVSIQKKSGKPNSLCSERYDDRCHKA